MNFFTVCAFLKINVDLSTFYRYVKHLLLLNAAGQYCCLATKAEDDERQYAIVLCNSIGTPMDSKFIDFGKTFNYQIIILRYFVVR